MCALLCLPLPLSINRPVLTDAYPLCLRLADLTFLAGPSRTTFISIRAAAALRTHAFGLAGRAVLTHENVPHAVGNAALAS